MKLTGRIISSERLNNSVCGNPRYRFTIETNDSFIDFKTKSNSSLGYYFRPYCVYDVEVLFHITKAGNLIADEVFYND